MATKTSQRIGIWVIAVVLTVGTLAGFLVMIISPQNETASQDKLQAQSVQFQKDQAAYQLKVDAQAKVLSKQYYDDFIAYKDQPAAFKPETVTKLSTKDLKTGTGAVIAKGSSYSAYYIGWNPKAKVFDQSIDGKTLKLPIPGGNLIEGWNEGVIGMKIGGVREISIPSAKAYGETGSGADIPANTPIKFVVMVITSPKVITQPAMPQELQQAYGQQ